MRVLNIAAAHWSSLQAELRPGRRLVLETGRFTFDALSLPLAQARRWNSRRAALCLPSTRIDRDRLAQGVALVDAALKARLSEQDPLWCSAYRRFGFVLAALNAAEPQLDAAVKATIGLGPGLTPSGDDLLTGVLIGLDVAGRTTQRARLATCIKRYTAETSEVSGDSLHQACSGWLNTCITDVLLALAAPTEAQKAGPDALHRALRAQCEIGHYSGLDILVGLFAVLKCTFLSAPCIPKTMPIFETI